MALPHVLPHVWPENGLLNGKMNGAAACFAAHLPSLGQLQTKKDIYPKEIAKSPPLVYTYTRNIINNIGSII